MSAAYDPFDDMDVVEPDEFCDSCSPDSPCEIHATCVRCHHGYGIKKDDSGTCWDCLNEMESR